MGREADRLADLPETGQAPITSSIAVFEAALGVCRKRHASVDEACDDVMELLRIANVRVGSIGGNEGRAALHAFARFGKGRGHPAQLNLGDCFAYAVARNHHVPMLFKLNDFSKMDIAIVGG